MVYVKDPQFEQPTFEFREIELGTDAGEYYVVNSGLHAGEEIAANGVFKRDGAAQLQGKISMMNPAGGQANTPHQHQVMAIDDNISESGASKTYEVPGAFRSQIKGIFNDYLVLSESLVESDVSEVKAVADKLLNTIKQVDGQSLNEDAAQAWTREAQAISASMKSFADSENLNDHRMAFSVLSDLLYSMLVKYQIPTNGFRMYCPMAFGNDGAYWLSKSEEIRNPYMGQQMLTCGNIKNELD